MKKFLVFTAMVILAVAVCVTAEAVPDKTVSVAASGTITASTALSVLPVTATYNTAADGFPTGPMADKKIVLTYSSNYNPWKIWIYTKNTQVLNKVGDTTGFGRYAKGGLATADGHNVVACKWVAKVGTNVTVPAVPTPTSLHNFIKDQRDEDDPATTLANQDESWAAAIDPVTGGYPNIAYGTPSGGSCIDPTNTTPGPNQYKGDAVNGSIAVYVSAMFGTGGVTPSSPAGVGVYSSPIYFDLYHE